MFKSFYNDLFHGKTGIRERVIYKTLVIIVHTQALFKTLFTQSTTVSVLGVVFVTLLRKAVEDPPLHHALSPRSGGPNRRPGVVGRVGSTGRPVTG